MSDATLRQVIREAQRAGRLGVLSGGARTILTRLARCCVAATSSHCNSYWSAYAGGSTDQILGGPDRVSAVVDGTAEDARELGAFLAALAELL